MRAKQRERKKRGERERAGRGGEAGVRIRMERLDTSKHSKEETPLAQIRDINERTATRV